MAMIEAAKRFEDYELVLAGAPSIEDAYDEKYIRVYNIANELYKILPGQPGREKMLQGYAEVRQRLGTDIAPDNAARIMVRALSSQE